MTEMFAIIGTSLWMMRTSMIHQRRMSEKFIEHLQKALEAQQAEGRQSRSLLRQLTAAVRRNSAQIAQLKEKLNGIDSNNSHHQKEM